MDYWRRFKPTHVSCVSGSEKRTNYTSHHLCCARFDSTTSRKLQQQTTEPSALRSWPENPSPSEAEDRSYLNVYTPQLRLQYTKCNSSRRSLASSIGRQASIPRLLSLLRRPPPCRLPTSMRLTTLILYVTLGLLCITASAAPFSVQHTRIQLVDRQSIPDQLENTGNEPAPVESQTPPRPLTPSPTTMCLPPFTLTPTPTTASTWPTSTITTSSTGNTSIDNGDDLGLNPGKNTPAAELLPTKPQLGMSPLALAGVIAGGIVFLSILVGLAIFFYRRSRRPEIAEIPIRRSKLGSRLGRRVFDSPIPSRTSSRSSSRRSSASFTGDKRSEGWLDKSTISRPKAAPAWVENGLLGVPKPAFVKRERENAEEGERWVRIGDIGEPRPGRPRSAEPLGRLSGMGMGMGYMK